MRSPSALSLKTPTVAWATLGLLSGLNLLNYLDRYVMSAVLPPLQADLHLNDADGGALASAFMLGYFLTAPIFGYLGDRYPRKYLMLSGVLVWSLATVASGFAQNFAEFFAIRVVVGVGEACFVTMSPSWISDLFAATRRNTALTLFYVAIPFGSAIGFTIGGKFADLGLWRDAFFWVGLPGILFALSLLFLREPLRGEADGLAGEVTTHPKPNFGEIGRLLLNLRYNFVTWGYAAQVFAIGAFGVWGPKFLHEFHGLTLGLANTIFGEMLAGAGLVGTLTGGFVATWLRKRTPAGYAWVMLASLLLAIPTSFFALTTTDAVASQVGLGFCMFFLFLPTGPITSQMFDIVPVHLRANAIALCTFFIHLFGDFSSPPLVGAVSDATHSLQKGVLILPVVLLIGALLWSLLVRSVQQPIKIEA
jgi:MFS transporter, Spinster family, sphingosine-1-phosphate transporter